MYNKGLIYRGERIINWDHKLKQLFLILKLFTKILQVISIILNILLKTEKAQLKLQRHVLKTMLGDTAIVVNPNDDRYKHLIGKSVILPIIGRELPIIGDDYVDIEFGSGAMKVTPAHDPNDFEIGEKTSTRKN